MSRLSNALLALGSVALAPLAGAQQQLFVIDSAGIVSEVVPYDAPNASAIPVLQVPLSSGEHVSGLAASPAGTLYVLIANGPNVSIVEVDPLTAQRTTLCTAPAVLADGLERRFDGSFVYETALTHLQIVDPSGCAVDSVNVSGGIGFNTSFGNVAFDELGRMVTVGGDGVSKRVDPLDGFGAGPFDGPLFDGVRGLEVDLDGTLFFATADGGVFAAGAQLTQVLPSGAGAWQGMALTLAADGQGMRVVCGGAPNSTGRASTIEVLGTGLVADEAFELRSRGLPVGSFGYWLTGPTSGTTAVGSGTLCIASPLQRYSLDVQTASSAGTVEYELDPLLRPDGSAIVAGETQLFQYWHRDTPGTSNLSGAVAVRFR